MKKRKEYALYKGDECLAIDNLDELSKKFNVQKKTLLFYQSPAHLKRMQKSSKSNYKILVRVDEE
ncbi:MAG: hypothetical protein E7161_04320 [Firmicutes bacterium]|nr:hypothetical protein [Bacillota bacterium]